MSESVTFDAFVVFISLSIADIAVCNAPICNAMMWSQTHYYRY